MNEYLYNPNSISLHPRQVTVSGDTPTNTEVLSNIADLESSPPTEAELPPRQSGCIHKPSHYVHEALEGTNDGGTA